MATIKEKVAASVEKLSAKLPGHHSTAGTTNTRSTDYSTGRPSDRNTGTVSDKHGGASAGMGGTDSYGIGGPAYTGAATGTATGNALISENDIIDSKTFTKTTDEEVLIEKKRYELEHRPVQEEYVVETRKLGEQRMPGGPTEIVSTDSREVEHRAIPAARGTREVTVQDVDVPESELREYATTTGPIGQTRGASNPSYDNATTTAPIGQSRGASNPSYDNATTTAPIGQSRGASNPSYDNATTTAPIGQSRGASNPSYDNATTTAPIGKSRGASNPLYDNKTGNEI